MSYKSLKISVSIIITCIFLYFLARGFDWYKALTILRNAKPSLLVLGVTGLSIGFCLRISRWYHMLKVVNPSVKIRNCSWPFISSLAINNILPFRAGDAMRILGFRDRFKVDPSAMLGILLLERILDLLSLIIVLYSGLYFSDTKVIPSTILNSMGLLGIIIFSILLFIVSYPSLITLQFAKAIRRIRFIKDPLAFKITSVFDNLITSFSLIRTPRVLITLTILSLAGWFFEGILYYSVAISLGIDVQPSTPFLVLSVGTLSTLLPSTPGYIGTFDYFVMSTMAESGVGRTDATVYSMLVHFLVWAPVTILGLGYLGLRNAIKVKSFISPSIVRYTK